MTDTNKDEAQQELRQVIADSFKHQTLWTTDWDAMQLTAYVASPWSLKHLIGCH